MATIDSLAPELLSEIMGHLHAPWAHGDLGDLWRACLVSRRWREPAQRTLFETVSLRVALEEDAVDQWRQSPARGRYRTNSLVVWGSSEPEVSIDVLEACPNLLSLSMGVGPDGGYAWCSSHFVEGLRSLHLSYPEDFPSHIRPLATSNLRHLNVHLRNLPSLDHLDAIFLPSRQSLTSLTLTDLDYNTTVTLANLFAKYPFPLVRRLAIKSSGVGSLLTELLNNIPSLITVEISEVRWRAGGHWDTSLGSLGACVTPTLQNVILDHPMDDEESIAEVLRVVRLSKAEGLRRIEIPRVPKYAFAGEAGLALLDECEKRSISLLCRYGYLTRSMMDSEESPSAPEGGASVTVVSAHAL